MRVDGSTSMRRNGRERPEAGRLPCPSIRSALAILTSVQPFSASRRTNPIRIDLPVGAVLSAGARPPAVAIATKSLVSCLIRVQKKYRRFTMGKARQLQCNSLLDQEKTRRRRNNGHQWKNNTKNNGKYTSRRNSGRHAIGLCARRWQADPCGDLARLKSKTRPRRCSSGRANVTLHLLPCAARAGNASGIRSIPAVHGCADHGADWAVDGREEFVGW